MTQHAFLPIPSVQPKQARTKSVSQTDRRIVGKVFDNFSLSLLSFSLCCRFFIPQPPLPFASAIHRTVFSSCLFLHDRVRHGSGTAHHIDGTTNAPPLRNPSFSQATTKTTTTTAVAAAEDFSWPALPTSRILSAPTFFLFFVDCFLPFASFH